MSNPTVLPTLEKFCGSWVFTTETHTFEVFCRRTAEELLHKLAGDFKVETSYQYLTRLNQEIRNGTK